MVFSDHFLESLDAYHFLLSTLNFCLAAQAEASGLVKPGLTGSSVMNINSSTAWSAAACWASS